MMFVFWFGFTCTSKLHCMVYVNLGNSNPSYAQKDLMPSVWLDAASNPSFSALPR